MDRQKLGKILMFAGIVLILLVSVMMAVFEAADINIPRAVLVALIITLLIVCLTMVAVGEWLFRARG